MKLGLSEASFRVIQGRVNQISLYIYLNVLGPVTLYKMLSNLLHFHAVNASLVSDWSVFNLIYTGSPKYTETPRSVSCTRSDFEMNATGNPHTQLRLATVTSINQFQLNFPLSEKFGCFGG